MTPRSRSPSVREGSHIASRVGHGDKSNTSPLRSRSKQRDEGPLRERKEKKEETPDVEKRRKPQAKSDYSWKGMVKSIRKELQEMGLLDDKNRIAPWGFRDEELEQKYQTFFWMTFAQNHKKGTLFLYSTATVGHSLASIKYLFLDADRNLILIIAATTRALLCGFTTYHFSQPHLTAWSKKFFQWLIWIVYWFIPGFHCLEALAFGASRSKLQFETVLITGAFPFFHPNYRYSQTWTSLVAWVPVFMQNYVYGSYDDVEEVLQWMGLALLCNMAGLVWGAWLGIERRRKYLTSLPPVLQRRASYRAESPARDRSPGPESHRRRSPSPSTRRPSLGLRTDGSSGAPRRGREAEREPRAVQEERPASRSRSLPPLRETEDMLDGASSPTGRSREGSCLDKAEDGGAFHSIAESGELSRSASLRSDSRSRSESLSSAGSMDVLPPQHLKLRLTAAADAADPSSPCRRPRARAGSGGGDKTAARDPWRHRSPPRRRATPAAPRSLSPSPRE